MLFVNDASLMPDSYASYLDSRIREKWEYPGLPIILKQRGRDKKDD
jgi:predicted GTPase